MKISIELLVFYEIVTEPDFRQQPKNLVKHMLQLIIYKNWQRLTRITNKFTEIEKIRIYFSSYLKKIIL